MFVLTRKVKQTICIGDDIEVTVIAINGSHVRFGINSPREVVGDRQAVARRKLSEAADTSS